MPRSDEPLLIDDDDRYGRLRLIGWWDQDKLAASRVLVVGAGALGNEVLKNLALVGIGQIDVVDFDTIERTNLTRSVLFRESDCGRSKAEVAASVLRGVNPDTRIVPYHADIINEIGLGLFRDVDVVIGCLDNREARLWVNRQCWKTGTPWVDGGIQEINGVVKVFVPPGDACYECAMTENDYRLINLRYSCPLLQQEDIQSGKVPTAPTISSIIAGLQSQEALKLIHGFEVEAGTAMVFNGVANQFYKTRFQRQADCLSHETYPESTALGLGTSATGTQLFERLRSNMALAAETPMTLVLDRELVLSIDCDTCADSRPLMRPRTRVSTSEANCPTCGETARPILEHQIHSDGELADYSLSSLGVPPSDIVRVTTESAEYFVALADDVSVVGG